MAKRRHINFGVGSDDDAEDYGNELIDGSDRAAAILAQATTEHMVRMALYSALILNTDDRLDRASVVKDIIGDDDSPGFLTFSEQIKLAYCMGVISRDDYSDLGILARIRNRFAHARHHRSFDKDPVMSMCKCLKSADEFTGVELPLSMRERYIAAGHVIGRRLGRYIRRRASNWTRRRRRKTNRTAPAKQAHRKQ